MKKLAILYTVALLVLLIMSQVVGCQEQPAPARPAPTPAPTEALPPTHASAPTPAPTPTPAPPAVDEPSLSENEVCSYVWSQLPFKLPNGYKKSQFLMHTRESTYEGNGEWKFVVLGSAKKDVGPTSTEIYEKTPGHWFEKESQEVTTYELKLTAVLNEETKIFEITSIDEFNEQVKTDWTETPVPKELRVQWVKGEYSGYKYHLEGSVENIGKIPINDIQVEFVLFDSDDNLLATERAPVEPETIAPGKLGQFNLWVYLKGLQLRSYNYRFITATGEEFFRVSEDVYILR